MALQIDIHLPDGVSQLLQTLKDFANASINSLTNSAHQVRVSLQETATQTTDKAINTVTTSVKHSWQTAEELQRATSAGVQTTITSAVSHWLAQHPVFFRLVEMLGWTTNHPIISLVILLLAIALAWSIIKAIVRLIETAGWSILQVPLKLLQALITVSFLYLTQIGGYALRKITGAKTSEVIPVTHTTIYQTKQQRLAEISSRLEQIQQEQHQLLQEAADLLVTTSTSKFQE